MWERRKDQAHRAVGSLPRGAVLLGGILLGLVLLAVGGLRPSTDVGVQSETDDAAQTEAYVSAQEEKIRDFCSRVEGVGEVSVTVSLESGYRRVYAKENGSYLSVASLSGGNTVCLSEEPPVIGGIAIVCDGGGDPAVRQRLIGLLRAAYGIGANKIYVAPSQNE